MGWTADKAFGEQAVNALVRYFSQHGLMSEVATGNFPAWDLLVRGSVEVKHDRRAADTGNFFVETHAHGQPSGISTTKATAWVLVTGRTAYFIGTEKLRAILDTLTPAYGPDEKQGRLLPIRTLRTLPYVATANLVGLL
jgi:hypothetical protein